MEEKLKSALSNAIEEFNNKSASILQLAYTSGGQTAVSNVEQGFDALRELYFEILKHQLDENNTLYEQLISAANTEAESLRTSINLLNNIDDILNLVAAVTSSIAQILTTLGV